MTTRNYEPIKVVAFYQARCTNCGKVEDDYYGDYSAWSDKGTPIEQVVDYRDWTEVDETDELLCPNCKPKDEDE
jgi:hypothetical protein